MERTIFYVAATIAVLLAGGGIAYAMWQLAVTLKQVRQTMMPQVELTLTEVQRNLNRVDELTKDVDVTVGEANQLMSKANRTADAVGDGFQSFNENVAVPLMIHTASAVEGVKAGFKTWRESRKKQPSLVVIAEPAALECAGTEAANI
ncbi:MAG: hypothetical protein ACK46X_15445 [Candidatus Sericytochromatia bacterium]